MTTQINTPGDKIASYVKTILVFENKEPSLKTLLPFFADGCPGIMYQETTNGLFVYPQNKKMPELFLYGQTIHPIELSIEGEYRLVVFQLYPFAVKRLLDLNATNYTDTCFDMSALPGFPVSALIEQLKNTFDLPEQVEILSSFLASVAATRRKTIDDKIQFSINLILNSKGIITVKELRTKLHITERTFERQFVAQVGVTPKQFVKIIQFQSSLTQLTDNNYAKLTDIVFENGFADQSHFIRTFKNFTGKTPVQFRGKK